MGTLAGSNRQNSWRLRDRAARKNANPPAAKIFFFDSDRPRSFRAKNVARFVPRRAAPPEIVRGCSVCASFVRREARSFTSKPSTASWAARRRTLEAAWREGGWFDFAGGREGISQNSPKFPTGEKSSQLRGAVETNSGVCARLDASRYCSSIDKSGGAITKPLHSPPSRLGASHRLATHLARCFRRTTPVV